MFLVHKRISKGKRKLLKFISRFLSFFKWFFPSFCVLFAKSFVFFVGFRIILSSLSCITSFSNTEKIEMSEREEKKGYHFIVKWIKNFFLERGTEKIDKHNLVSFLFSHFVSFVSDWEPRPSGGGGIKHYNIGMKKKIESPWGITHFPPFPWRLKISISSSFQSIKPLSNKPRISLTLKLFIQMMTNKSFASTPLHSDQYLEIRWMFLIVKKVSASSLLEFDLILCEELFFVLRSKSREGKTSNFSKKKIHTHTHTKKLIWWKRDV